MRRKGSLLGFVILAALLLGASTVYAAFPGQNGKIAYVGRTGPPSEPSDIEVFTMNADGTDRANITNSPRPDLAPVWSPDGQKIVFASTRLTAPPNNAQLYVMNADGTGLAPLTAEPSVPHAQPTWSPDGTKLAFTRYSGSAAFGYDIYTMNSDGTDRTNITNSPGSDEKPAWSPDGTKIAFKSNRVDPLNHDIYTMNPDGTGVTQLTDNPQADVGPDWSPDGTKIVFTSFRNFARDIYVMDADGNDVINLTNTALGDDWPSWSPDGTKIVFATLEETGFYDIYSMNADGTDVTRLTSGPEHDENPDWQPLPVSSPPPDYDHPRVASLGRVSLVPDYRQTISSTQCTARGGTNSSHGPPLAFASCDPPGFVPGTVAHLGPASSSWASYATIYGDTNAANGDQANVTVRAALNDIRTAGGGDYPASLTLVTKLRITDRFNGGSQSEPGTVADFDYSTPISCTATTGPEGASCNLDTSADSVTAGTIKENKATVIQVFRFRVNDSGANGTRGDSDDRTFATQGIYIP